MRKGSNSRFLCVERNIAHMIGSLRGTVLEIHPTSLLLEVNNVGYKLFCTPSTLSSSHVAEEKFFYIHDIVREDARDLYGFSSVNEQRLFHQLIQISGVGPKVALTVLSAGNAEDVRAAILQGDLTRLTSVPGVGKKTAQKIILELKGQLVEEQTTSTEDTDVIEALVTLGYSASIARDVLKNIAPSIVDVSARVREALRVLAK